LYCSEYCSRRADKDSVYMVLINLIPPFLIEQTKYTLYLSAFVQMLSRPARLGYPCTHAGSCSLVPLSSPSLVCRLVRSRAQRRRHCIMQQAGVCVRTAHTHHSVRTVGEWVRTVVVVETALAIRSDVSISSPTTDDGRRSKPNSLFRDST
jgi:hypothetical protein